MERCCDWTQQLFHPCHLGASNQGQHVSVFCAGSRFEPPNPLTPSTHPYLLGELFTFTNALLCLHSPLVFLSVCPHSTFTDPQSTTDGKFWTGKHFLHFNRRKGKIKNPSTHSSSHFSIFPVNQLKPHTPVHIARTRTGRPSYSRPSCLYSRCVSKNVGAQ